jgi:hypothetical protein
VNARVEVQDLAKAGSAISLQVYDENDKKLGTVDVGQGSIRVFKKGAKDPTAIYDWAKIFGPVE